MSTSSYGREQHQQFLHGILGEDLWFLKDGSTPRDRMNDQHVTAAINDGNHEPARQAIAAIHRFMPVSTRTSTDTRYAPYGLVGPDSEYISYRCEFPEWMAGRRSQTIGRSHLLNHLFAIESILPSHQMEDQFDCLLIDVDVDLWGDSIDLFVLPPEEIAEIIAPWSDALTRMGIPARIMLSGFRGFWIQVMMTEPIYRCRAEHIYHTICQAAGARSSGGAYSLPGDYYGYHAECGNLSENVCRLPWSLREDTGNVSVHVDPQTGVPDPSGLMFWEEWDPASLFCPLHRIVGVESPGEDPRPIASKTVIGEDVDDVTSRPSHRIVGVESPPASSDQGDPTPPEHLDWDWHDIITEACGGPSIPGFSRWQDLIIVAPDGQKRWTLVGGNPDIKPGNIALVAGRMKHELGYVDWDMLKDEYSRAYEGADQSKGGTIAKWIDDLKRDKHDGRDIVPCPPSLTETDVERCRWYADDIVAGITRSGPRPDADDIFHVLLMVCRFTQAGHGEIDTDFLARKSGINPYRTREAQLAVEGVEENDGDWVANVRHNRTSKNARDRLMRVTSYVCDLDPEKFTGKHPFRRTKIGTNDRSDPRVQKKGKPVGSEFERVPGHQFWAG